jgi:hypothetical protein
LTNIVIAPVETGSGVPKAAAGMSFLASTSLGGATHANRRLDGWAHADIEVAGVEIGSPGGDPRPSADIDRDAAMQIAAIAPDRIMVVVDACQLRSPPEQCVATSSAGA